MGYSQTALALSQAQLLRNKKTKKKKRKKKFHRVKTDAFVLKQHEIFKALKKIDGKVEKDFRKAKQWWDFVLVKERIVIKVLSSRSFIKQDALNRVKALGYTVLYVQWNLSDLDKLVEDVQFILGKGAFVERRAKELNRELPKSEKWFLEKIKKEWFWKRMKFKQNVPMFDRFIYDLFSKKYRLCIEIDGSIHEEESVKQKDNFKNQYTTNRGFHIIRVKAFDEESYSGAVTLIKQLFNNSGSKTFKIDQQTEFNNKINDIEKSGKLPF